MRYTLGELAEIIDGDRGKNYPQQNEFFDSGYCLFLNTGNVTNHGFSFEQNQFITKEKCDILRKGKLQRGDIVYTTRGTVGNAAYYSEAVEYEHIRINSGMVIIRPNNDIVDTRFLYQILKSDYYRPFFKQFCTGSAQPQLPIKNFSKIELDIPALAIQTRIADILSAYDDLIENNQKQIKLLEEAAQRLYKEWFVDLRFPGYEDVKVVDGVPEGWKQKTVKDCLAFHGNGGWGKETPTGKNMHSGKVIRGTDIEDIKSGHFENVPTRYHSDNDIKSKTLTEYDLVFELSNGNINNIGRCLFIDDLILKQCGENTICASFCKLLRPLDKIHSLLLYLEIQDMQTSGRMIPLKKHGANGINNFDFDGFLNHTLLISEDITMAAPIEAIMKNISKIQRKITLLKETRDRLLPKLMSGEMEV